MRLEGATLQRDLLFFLPGPRFLAPLPLLVGIYRLRANALSFG